MANYAHSNERQKPNTMHPLDNVIWNALTTRDAQFAESFGEARRFLLDVNSLGAFREPTEKGYQSLAGLLGTGGTTGLFLEKPYQPLPGWSLVGGAPLLQMVHENGGATASRSGYEPPLVELGRGDVPEMVALATLTKPGPFAQRTHELGTYLGIRQEGELVAMAGERLKVPGYTEVSAVCTHPDHTGKGYAGMLMTEVMRRIRDQGEVPFLHVRQDNLGAIQLYRKLGFRERAVGHFALLRKD
jgi:ribosomal protein S18 acetylase RimI-like enzyme